MDSVETGQDKELVTKFLEKAGVEKEEIAAVTESLEDQAAKKGWRPDGPKSAKEFLDDEPFYEERRAKNKELKELQLAIKDMKDQLDRRERIGYQNALEDLKRKRSDAIALGDESTVNEVDTEINNISNQLPKESSVLSDPVVKEFEARNSGWLKDRSSLEHLEMQEYFVRRDAELQKYRLPLADHTKVLEESMRKQFATYFSQQDDNGSMVGSISDSAPTGAVKRTKSYTFKNLTDDQKEVCRRLVKRCGMTEQEYIDSLVKSGELK